MTVLHKIRRGAANQNSFRFWPTARRMLAGSCKKVNSRILKGGTNLYGVEYKTTVRAKLRLASIPMVREYLSHEDATDGPNVTEG